MGSSSDAHPILLSANGREYTVVFSARSIRRLEARSGKPFGAITDEIARGSYTAMAQLVQAGLEREHPDIDEDQVDDLLDELGLQGIEDPIARALERDLGKSGNPPKPGRRGTKPSRPR